MSLYSKIRGTIETIFALGDAGPQLKANAGSIEVRNASDTAYTDSRALLVEQQQTIPSTVTQTIPDGNTVLFAGRLTINGSLVLQGSARLAGVL
jgi:hypothetical protein